MSNRKKFHFKEKAQKHRPRYIIKQATKAER